MNNLNCFKPYGIRGVVDEDIDEYMAFRIGFAMATHLNAQCIVVGGDNRLSSPSLRHSVIDGIRSAGCNAIDIGLCGTEEMYFATAYNQCSGGVMITASHSAKQFNGMKLVGPSSCPINNDNGLLAIKMLVELYQPSPVLHYGKMVYQSYVTPYIEHIFNFVNLNNIKPLKIVVNAGNGSAGHIINTIETEFLAKRIPVELIKLNNQPDGDFPLGMPNPTLAHHQKKTKDAVIAYHADLGLAWDSEFERCFFFDGQGNYIESYYIVALLAKSFLNQNGCQKIIHDPRLTWNTIEAVNHSGGQAIECKTGHACIKARMREEHAVYGAQLSAHHYSRDFFYCDSGMIPWLMIIELLSLSDQSLNKLVSKQMDAYPSSGEINREVHHPHGLLDIVEETLSSQALKIDHIDGLSMTFDDWRFNLRLSNTQSLIRLNVESRGNVQLMEQQTAYLLGLIEELPDNISLF